MLKVDRPVVPGHDIPQIQIHTSVDQAPQVYQLCHKINNNN